MKISTKGRYALRLMLDLAEHKDEGYIPLKIIAERQGISKNYLEQIISLMKNTELLSTTRGFQGGYKLAREPREYTVGEILRVTEGEIAPVACLEPDKDLCGRADNCLTRGLWQGLGQVMRDYLDGTTLQDLLDGNGKQPPSGLLDKL